MSRIYPLFDSTRQKRRLERRAEPNRAVRSRRIAARAAICKGRQSNLPLMEGCRTGLTSAMDGGLDLDGYHALRIVRCRRVPLLGVSCHRPALPLEYHCRVRVADIAFLSWTQAYSRVGQEAYCPSDKIRGALFNIDLRKPKIWEHLKKADS